MFSRLPAVLSCAILAALSVRGLSAGEWTEARNKDGILIETREVEGYRFHAFRGTTVVDASMDQLVAFLENIPGMSDWFYLVEEARVLDRHAPDRLHFYVIQNAPVVKDRDLVAELVIRQLPDGTVVFEMTQEDSYLPESDRYVRIPRFSASYTLSPADEGITLVFEALSDPGGSIPASLANALIVDIPYRSLSDLKGADFESYSGKNRFNLSGIAGFSD